MERANSNEPSIELTMNELDAASGGNFSRDHTGLVLAAVLLSPAMAFGFGVAAAVVIASGGTLSATQ